MTLQRKERRDAQPCYEETLTLSAVYESSLCLLLFIGHVLFISSLHDQMSGERRELLYRGFLMDEETTTSWFLCRISAESRR